jgi:hypothetical protein
MKFRRECKAGICRTGGADASNRWLNLDIALLTDEEICVVTPYGGRASKLDLWKGYARAVQGLCKGYEIKISDTLVPTSMAVAKWLRFRARRGQQTRRTQVRGAPHWLKL